MPLDDNLQNQLASVLDLLCPKLSASSSMLLNNEVSISLANFSDSILAAGNAQVAEPSAALKTSFTEASFAELVVVASQADASQIAALMAGAESDGSMDDEKLEAFNSAIAQSLAEALPQVEALQDPSLGLGAFTAQLLDPANADSLNLALANPEQERTTLILNLQSESGLNINLSVDISLDLVNALVMMADSPSEAAGGAGATNTGEQQTVGDVMGTDFAEIIDEHDPDAVDEKKNLNLLMDIRLGLIVELGRSEMHLKDILKLTKGSIIELDRFSGEAVDLFVNNKLIARGEVVVIDDNFGLRITQLAGTQGNREKELGLIET